MSSSKTRLFVGRALTNKDSKYILKRAQDLSINSIYLVELTLQVMKKVPRFLAIYLETCSPQERFTFLGDLPGFYFDYTELKPLADFLVLFFGLKAERGETKDLTKHTVILDEKDFLTLFDGLVWESDSVAFCHGLLADLVRDLKALKRINMEDPDVLSIKDVSTSINASSLNADKSVNTSGSSLPKHSSGRQASIRGVKITTGEEKYESISQYRHVLEVNIRDSLSHNQATKNLVKAELLSENVKKTFSEVV